MSEGRVVKQGRMITGRKFFIVESPGKWDVVYHGKRRPNWAEKTTERAHIRGLQRRDRRRKANMVKNGGIMMAGAVDELVRIKLAKIKVAEKEDRTTNLVGTPRELRKQRLSGGA